MLGKLGTKAVLWGAGAALFTAAGCTVDTVVYDRPYHHDREVVVVEDAPPPPPQTVVVAAPEPQPVQEEVVVDAPPPPPQEVVVAQPGPDFVYIQGSYVRRGGGWVWVHGYWGRPPHGHRVWRPAHWEHGPHGYIRVEGRWD